jgi:inosine/xanthosine triphosphate pyrophosphatase family protein
MIEIVLKYNFILHQPMSLPNNVYLLCTGNKMKAGELLNAMREGEGEAIQPELLADLPLEPQAGHADVCAQKMKDTLRAVLPHIQSGELPKLPVPPGGKVFIVVEDSGLDVENTGFPGSMTGYAVSNNMAGLLRLVRSMAAVHGTFTTVLGVCDPVGETTFYEATVPVMLDPKEKQEKGLDWMMYPILEDGSVSTLSYKEMIQLGQTPLKARTLAMQKALQAYNAN